MTYKNSFQKKGTTKAWFRKNPAINIINFYEWLEEVRYIQVPGIVWEAGKRSFRTTWETNPQGRHYLSMHIPNKHVQKWDAHFQMIKIDVWCLSLLQQFWWTFPDEQIWWFSYVVVGFDGKYLNHSVSMELWIWDRISHHKIVKTIPNITEFYLFCIVICKIVL